LPGREDHVQAFGQILKRHHVIETKVFVIEHIEECIVVIKVCEAVLFEQLHNGCMAGVEFSQFFFGEAQ
jgi:hypothetical protein